MRLKLILAACLVLSISIVGCGSPTGLKSIPLPSPTLMPAPALTPESRLISISFDDAFYNQYEVALPVLVKYGYRASFGVITDHIGQGHSLTEYMDEGKLQELAEWGMDIASHTRTHPHLTEGLSDDELRREIIDSKQDLEKMGFNVRTMIYPYYECNDRVIEYVREAGYVCARAGWPNSDPFDLTTTDPVARYRISSVHITRQDMENFKRIVEKAGRYSLVSLVYHFIAHEGPETTTTPVSNFYAQMSYLHRKGFTVVLLPDLFMP